MIEDFFDLRIATDEDAPDADLVRRLDPDPADAVRLVRQGWFYKPVWVGYATAVAPSMAEHLARFAPKHRRNVARLLRDVPRAYRLVEDPGLRELETFRALYRRTVVAKPRGKDRLAEVEDWRDPWLGLYLFHGDAMAAGVLVQEAPEHRSVAFGAFDPGHRKLDLEHFLILQALARSIEDRHAYLSLGIDTNRYGHHLSLGVAPYKLRIGFAPFPYEPGGREVVKIQRFDRFESGLFFYAYGALGLAGHLFTRDAAAVQTFRHRTAPPVEVHAMA